MYNKNKNKMTQEQLRMQMLAGIITEGQYKSQLNENQALGNLFYPEEDEEGIIEYYYDKNKLVEFIKNLGYEDVEEVAGEIMTISSPYDDLERYRRIYNDPDLDMTEVTLDMVKKSIEDEFEK